MSLIRYTLRSVTPRYDCRPLHDYDARASTATQAAPYRRIHNWKLSSCASFVRNDSEIRGSPRSYPETWGSVARCSLERRDDRPDGRLEDHHITRSSLIRSLEVRQVHASLASAISVARIA